MKVMDINQPSSPSTGMIQVLVVEDEYVIAANLQENLESLGYGVLDIASSGAEAVAKAMELHPELVLMDIRLQGEMDGIQAAEQIWNQLQIPVIYVTGHSDKSTLERAKVTFPFGYVIKPVKGKELYVAIETALNRYEREQLLSTVLRSIGDGMIVTNTQGLILFLNRSAEFLTGWQQEEAHDRELTEVFKVVYEDTGLPIGNVAVTAIQQDTILFLDGRLLLTTKERTTLPITNSVAPIRTQKGLITGAVLIFRDDSQRRLQEEHNQTLKHTQVLQRQNEELQSLDQLKDDFLSTVSHELRTPLASIKVAIQMLEISLDRQRLSPSELETDPQSQQAEKYLRILHEQCDQELNLVNDLLQLQNLQAEVNPVDLIPIELLDWIPHVAETFQTFAEQRQQRLQLLLPPTLPPLMSDLSILTRILKELLTNACKYTPTGEVITVSAQQVEERLQVVVSNSGVEIPAEELLRIFDKFYRIPMSDRWKQGGTGLGLALVKKSVTYLGGSIWAESDTGETRFIVELPLSPR